VMFGLGLSATVAPLTATVLSSVAAGHSGVASGVNNAVARVAGLLAIAALGAVVSGSFARQLDHDLAAQPLTPQTRVAVNAHRTRPLVTDASDVPPAQRALVETALVDSSVQAFRTGMLIAAALVGLGGVISLVGIENPRPRVRCADCPGGALAPPAEEAATAA
jgi:hypothetical protein